MDDRAKVRAAFAGWLARQHLQFDPRLTQVIYLPTDAPDDEVRLLEVNTGLYPGPRDPILPVETTPAIGDLPFRVQVADVTPDEWKAIQTGSSLLPASWKLEGKTITRRGQ